MTTETIKPVSFKRFGGDFDGFSGDLGGSFARYGFAVISPRLIFHSDWAATDQVVLQYSRWLNGSLTTIRTGSPPDEDVTQVPDEHMISLSASMWW